MCAHSKATWQDEEYSHHRASDRVGRTDGFAFHCAAPQGCQGTMTRLHARPTRGDEQALSSRRREQLGSQALMLRSRSPRSRSHIPVTCGDAPQYARRCSLA